MSTHEIESRRIESVETAVEYETLTVPEIGPWLAKVYGEVAAYLARKGAGPAGMPFARYHRVDDDTFEVEAGMPATTPTGGEGDIEPSDLPGGLVAVAMHLGPYDAIAPVYVALDDWVRAQGGTPTGDPWEIYFNDPHTEPDPARLRTDVVMPYHT